MGKLMLIAVDVDTGTIPDPHPASPPLPNFPKVIGIIDSSDFDVWETNYYSTAKPKELKGRRLQKSLIRVRTHQLKWRRYSILTIVQVVLG